MRNLRYDLAMAFLGGVLMMAGLAWLAWIKVTHQEPQ